LLVSDEVLVLRSGYDPYRMLIGLALVRLPGLIDARAPFEVRGLDQTVLATFDGETIKGRPEIIASLKPISSFLDLITEEAVRVAREVSRAEAAQAENG
jgi:hypothetical protein